MTKNQALKFLSDHQPLPPDDVITQDILTKYDEVQRYFRENPDDRCVPLFINSFGGRSGHGVYQLIENTISKHSYEAVVLALIDGLNSKCLYVRIWSAGIASSYPDDRLYESLIAMAENGEVDERFNAVIAISFYKTPEASKFLKQLIKKEKDVEIKKAFLEIISIK